jgi:hypothetical protein
MNGSNVIPFGLKTEDRLMKRDIGILSVIHSSFYRINQLKHNTMATTKLKAKKLPKKGYGWIFDKQGNLKSISAPTFANGKPVKKHTKTVTGKIPDSVGYPGFPSK